VRSSASHEPESQRQLCKQQLELEGVAFKKSERFEPGDGGVRLGDAQTEHGLGEFAV
jgi:hypothetical protein